MVRISVELATAYVSLSASARGLRKEVDRELGGAGVEAGKKVGGGFGDSLKKWGKRGALFAGATIATSLGVALTKGLGRLTAIETAQAKLRGLGHDAGSVDKIMANALASVKGTAFGLGEAATTAAGAVAAGVKPGKDLEGVLKSVANSAAAAGVGISDMGSVYGKVASLGKAQNDSLQQVADKGIPIYQALADQLGVTTEEVFNLASKGKVSFEDFEKAMTSASGTVASEMGKTFTGSLANTWAAFGRIGANLLSGVFVKLAPALQGVTGWLEKLEPVAKRVGEAIGSFVDRAATGVQGLYDLLVKGDFSGKLREAFGWEEDSKAVDVLFRIRDAAQGVISLFTRQGTGKLAAALGVDQGHVVITMLQGVRDLVTRGIPAGFRKAREVAGGLFKLFTKQGTGQLAKALGVEQGSPVITGLQTLRDLATTAFAGIRDAIGKLDFSSWSAFKDSLSTIGGDTASGLESMGSSLGKIAPKLGQVVAGLPKLAGSVGTILGAGIKVLVGTLGFLADNIDTIVKLLPYLVAGYAAWRVASVALTAQSNALQWAQVSMAPVLLANNTLRLINITLENRQTKARLANTASTAANTTATSANTGAQNMGILARARAVVGLVAQRVATVATTVATKAWTVAQRALNLVLRANPIGIVITALVALGAGLVLAYKKSETFRRVVDRAWAGVKAAALVVVDWFKNTAWPWLRDVFTWIGDKVRWLWENIYKPYWTLILDKIKAVVSWIKDTAWPWVRDAFGKMATKASDIKDKIVGAWDSLRGGISSGWDKIKGIFDKFKSGLSSLRDRFRSVKSGIADTWAGLVRAVATPIRAVIQFVNDKFLGRLENALNKIPGVSLSLPRIPVPSLPSIPRSGSGGGRVALAMAAGGVVPGFSPHARADNIPAMLTAGEFVLPVAATKRLMSLLGPGGMESLRRGLPGFASGGPVGGARGGGLGKSWEWLTDVFSDAKGWVKKKIDGFLSAIGDSWPAQAVLGVAGKVASGIGGWLKDKLLGSSVDGQGNVIGGQHVNYGGRFGWAPSGLSWPTLWAMTKMVAPEAVLTSSYRPGAITASGIPSLHGMGRAIDVVSSDMMSTFLKMRAAFGGFASQLYYTPAGGLQIGYRDATVAATHRDHIHFGYADGGLVRKPFVADAGAVLRPGINVLDNRTGGPEPLGRLDKPLALAQADLDYLADRINDGALRAALRGAEKQARLERAR